MNPLVLFVPPLPLTEVLEFCSSSYPRLSHTSLWSTISPQACLLWKQTSPLGLSTLPLSMLLTAKSSFREAGRCPAAHGLLTKMCLPFIPWSFPFPKAACKVIIWSHSMSIHWPSSVNCAKSVFYMQIVVEKVRVFLLGSCLQSTLVRFTASTCMWAMFSNTICWCPSH